MSILLLVKHLIHYQIYASNSLHKHLAPLIDIRQILMVSSLRIYITNELKGL